MTTSMGLTRWSVIANPTRPSLNKAMELRYRVFVVEQSVPLELEQDGLDDQAHHVVLEVDEACIATGRLMLKPEARGVVAGKAQRIAVDPSWRGKGAGRAVMKALEDRARELGARQMLLASQISAVGFYERLGYERFGERFMDAGIEHFWMALDLS